MEAVLHVDGIPEGSEVVYRHPRTGEEFRGSMDNGDFVADANPSGLVHCLDPPRGSIRVLRKPFPLVDISEYEIGNRTDWPMHWDDWDY